MRVTRTIPAFAAVATLALAGCSAGAEGSGSDGEAPDEIVISLVPSVEGADLKEALGPLTDYLSEGLGIEVTGRVASDYTATVEALGADQAQVIITDAGSLFNAINRYDAELILRDVRYGATSYASMAMTNKPEKYCSDEPVSAVYPATGEELLYCNGTEPGEEAKGQGPAGLEALSKITPGTKVALQAATSPAGYQYPVVSMREQGIDTENDIEQIPVSGNNNAVLAVNGGDAEVGFAYWDARSTVTEEAPEVAENVVVFAYTEMIPNGGVAVSSDLPEETVTKLTELLDTYAESSDQAADVMYELVGLSDWTTETAQDEIMRYGEVLAEFAQ